MSYLFSLAGEFGIVYRGRVGLTKRDVAVKTLKGLENVQNMVTYSSTVYAGDFDQDEVDTFVEESLKMGRFKHAHVMGLIGVCLDAGSAPYIIMPYMANGSLLKYLKRERKNIVLSEEADEDEVKSLCTDYGEFHLSNIFGWYNHTCCKCPGCFASVCVLL